MPRAGGRDHDAGRVGGMNGGPRYEAPGGMAEGAESGISPVTRLCSASASNHRIMTMWIRSSAGRAAKPSGGGASMAAQARRNQASATASRRLGWGSPAPRATWAGRWRGPCRQWKALVGNVPIDIFWGLLARAAQEQVRYRCGDRLAVQPSARRRCWRNMTCGISWLLESRRVIEYRGACGKHKERSGQREPK